MKLTCQLRSLYWAFGMWIIVLLTSIGAAQSPASAQMTSRSGQTGRNTSKSRAAQSYTFEDLLNGKPVAIEGAKRAFATTTDPNRKERVASVLVSIGVRDPVYYNYIVDAASNALESTMPWPTLYDQQGNVIRNSINPEFLKWCDKRHLNHIDAFEAAYYKIPMPWLHLAAAGDQRSYSLLIRGLHSSNFMIVALAASGLAKLQDSRAIPEMIAAYHRSPVETRYEIAEALLYFPDQRAQAAAEKFITNKADLARSRERIRTDGLKGLFGY